jgi:urea transport system substrate-binding protein
MNNDAQVEELLLAWEESRAQGEPLSPEELCRDCPMLLERVQRRIRDLRAISSVLDLAAFREGDASTFASLLTAESDRGLRPPDPLAGDVLSLPGYKILSELGRGGMGVVYKAWQLGLERLVALKVILAGKHAAASELARFHAEARLIARLRHPNIVQIFDLGDHEGRPYYAMEYLEAGSLDRALDRHRLSPRPAAELVETLARAVHYAHQQGIIHRDLKPGNILLAGIRAPADGEVDLGIPKIGDFGLALQVDALKRVTRSGAVLGTPAYMAPEQAAHKDRQVGPATDVYGLGVLLYQLLTGVPPFRADTDWETLQAVVNQEPQPPSRRRPDCPPVLEEICLRCLRKSPSERYPSGEALADDLHRFQAGERLSPPPRSSSRGMSRRTWLATTGAAALSLSAGAYLLFGRQLFPKVPPSAGPPIRIGLLHAGPGPLVISGDAILDSELLAVLELNNSGGLLGRAIEAVTLEDPNRKLLVTEQAERLIVEEKVSVLIGGSTSAARKQVKEVVEKHDHLLLYPMEFEGLEESDNIIYLGAIPNQLMFPAIKDWLLELRGKRRYFVVGSDSLLPRACAEIVKEFVATLGDAQIIEEEFLPVGSSRVGGIVQRVGDAKPEVLLNLIRGDDSLTLFKEMRQAGLRPDRLPTVSFFFTEQEMRSLKRAEMTGDYLVSSYFESIVGEENARYLEALQEQYGPQRIAFDDTETGFSAVNLWACAVRAAETDEPRKVRRVIGQQDYVGPGGRIRIDPATNYAYKYCRVGRIKEDGSVEIEWSSPGPIAPDPFPGTRGRKGWEDWLQALYEGWGNRWINPVRE